MTLASRAIVAPLRQGVGLQDVEALQDLSPVVRRRAGADLGPPMAFSAFCCLGNAKIDRRFLSRAMTEF
jgi:hypothetical protein